MKKIISAAIVAAIFVIIALYLIFLRNQGVADYIQTSGIIEATEVELSPEVGGRIIWLCCNEGDRIEKASVAIKLDSAELKARVKEQIAAAKEVEAEMERLSILIQDGEKDLKRISTLYKEGMTPEREFDSARAKTSALKAELNAAKARKSEVEAKGELLLVQLKDTEVSSPIDGVIAYKAYETGEVVSPGFTVYTVHDLENIWARVDLEETKIGRAMLGARALVESEATGGKTFEGQVMEIGSVGGFATQRDATRGRPDIKTFRVKVKIKGHGGFLKPGMTVSVKIFLEGEK